MQQQRVSVKTLALIGVLSAMVLVLSMVSIPIGSFTRLHFGNIMCLLGGMLFGPWVGGLSAGIGSMLYDFTDPRFISEFWITFIMKFAMGFVAGWLARRTANRRHFAHNYLVPAVGGQLVYLALYLAKLALQQHFVMGNPWAAVGPVVGLSALTSGVNAAISVAACLVLAPAVSGVLRRSGLFAQQTG